jgi:hypothetical protein
MQCSDRWQPSFRSTPLAPWRRYVPLAALLAVTAIIVCWTAVGRWSHEAEPQTPATGSIVWIEDLPLFPSFESNDAGSFAMESDVFDAGGLMIAPPVFGELLAETAPGSLANACDAVATDLPRERHRRADYLINPPDVLLVNLHSDAEHEDVCRRASGEYLVNPDGKIELNESLGSVDVGGSHLDTVAPRILDLVRQELPNAEVEVSVFAQNSKVYYVIVAGHEENECGDSVIRCPLIGDETVKDALAGLRDTMPDVDLEAKQVWVARPCAGNCCDEILSIDLEKLLAEDASGDCCLEPGDRIFVAEPSNFWETVGGILNNAWESISQLHFETTSETY